VGRRGTESLASWCATTNGQQLAYVYFEPGRRSAAKLITKDRSGYSVSM
jgi:hypothetical protein